MLLLMIHRIGEKTDGFVKKSFEIGKRRSMNVRLFLQPHARARGAVEHPLRELEGYPPRFVLQCTGDKRPSVPTQPSMDNQSRAEQSHPAVFQLDDLEVVSSVAWASS